MTTQCEIRHMRYFIAVAEELSFRRAADRLNLAQPALSRAIRQLEDNIEVRLLERSSRRVELTEAGRVFLDGCSRNLAGVQKTIDDTQRAQAGEIGHLNIGYTDFAISGALPGIMQEFRAQLPGITVDLAHMVTAVQLEALRRDEIQVGFMTGPLSESGIENLTVQDEGLVVVMPDVHPLAELAAVPLDRLSAEPFIMGQEAFWSHFHSHVATVCRIAGFSPNVVQDAYNSQGIFGLVAANMGLTIYVDCARNYHRKGVAIRPLAGTTHRVPTVAAWKAGRISPALGKLIEFLAGWLQTHSVRSAADPG